MMIQQVTATTIQNVFQEYSDMYFEGEEVRACQEVTKQERDVLVKNGIKPGTKGVVISEVSHTTVNFGGKIVTLRSESIEVCDSKKYGSAHDEDAKLDAKLDVLRGMFGMK